MVLAVVQEVGELLIAHRKYSPNTWDVQPNALISVQTAARMCLSKKVKNLEDTVI
jgi:hypothetical protein